MVFWITGLSCAGKTTIARRFYDCWKKKHPDTVFLNGDELREVFGNDFGHTLEDRLKVAQRNARLCRMLAHQGIHVIIATIALFHQVQRWNRENIPDYQEIYVRVPMEVLKQRDRKGIYGDDGTGGRKNVFGVDLAVEEPENPDMVLDNGEASRLEDMVSQLVARFLVKGM